MNVNVQLLSNHPMMKMNLLTTTWLNWLILTCVL